MPFATLSLHGPCFADRFQLPFEPGNPFLYAAAIDFQLRLTRATRPDTAGLPGQVMPHPGKPRQKILQLRQLYLQAAFPAPSALRKNIENQLRPIENFTGEQILQVPRLPGGKFIIKNDRGPLLNPTRVFDGLSFAATDIVRSSRFRQLLRDRIDYFRTRG